MVSYDCPTCGMEMEIAARRDLELNYVCTVCSATLTICLEVVHTPGDPFKPRMERNARIAMDRLTGPRE